MAQRKTIEELSRQLVEKAEQRRPAPSRAQVE
jgi:hypothetical protein